MTERDSVVYFAKTNFRGSDRTFGVRAADRRQHMYVIGKTGTGKTTLIKNLALQDIANGEGIAIVDPHGSFVEEVLEQIPENRVKDVLYINPVDTEFPIGFNILEVSDPQYKHLVASDLMGIFTKIWANVWSARMEYILSNCVLALLDTPGSTLLGITRILVDPDYRKKIVDNIKDPVVRSFWINEYESWRDQFRNEAIVPIQNKVGQFLSTPMIRNMVGQEKSSFNIFELMNQRKILLVNVAKGRIGEDNAQLLGAMLITKIQLAAMERVRIPEHERKDFFLYVDEFQNFATDSFANILSEARKYRLNIIIVHQYIGQLVTETTTRVRDAVFGNVGTLLAFRVGAVDAEFLEKEFEPEFNIQDMVNLPNRCIYVKLMVNGETSRPFSGNTLPPFVLKHHISSADAIIANTRKQFARPREEVESKIYAWSEMLSKTESATPSKPSKSDEPRYAITCSVCGKTDHVNFKPDEKRPIYCSDCLKKVQSGEITPPKIQPPKEVSASKPKQPSQHINAGELALKPVSAKPLSLKDLPKPVSRRQANIPGLKDALKSALKPKQESKSDPVIKPGEVVKL